MAEAVTLRYNTRRACSSVWKECNPPKVEVTRSNRVKHTKKIIMKRLSKLFILPTIAMSLSACGFFQALQNEHQDEFSALTGQWVLHENLNQVNNTDDAYFVIDGSKGVMTCKYYMDGKLVKDHYFWVNYDKNDHPNYLSFNQCDEYKGKTTDGGNFFFEQSINEITQFCYLNISHDYQFIEGTYNAHEYKQLDCPYAFGIYVKEGAEYFEFKTPKTAEAEFFNGWYYLDDEHYFNLLTIGYDYKSLVCHTFMVYYSPDLAKPIQGGLSVYVNKDHTAPAFGLFTTYETYWKLGKHAEYANADISFENVSYTENSFTFESAKHNTYCEWDGLELINEYYFDENLDESVFVPGTYVKR